MSQLSDLCEQIKLIAVLKEGNRVNVDAKDDWRRKSTPWTVTLRLEGRSITVPFFTGAAIKEPSAADVVSSLCLDADSGKRSFAEFCADLGYDEDSRAAERTWRACAKLAPRVAKFLGSHFDAIAGAEH